MPVPLGDGPINPTDPVDAGHPLNAGRFLWLAGLPQWAGGAAWFDFYRRSPATLTSTGVWRPAHVPPFFSLEAANASAATFGTWPLTARSVALWVRGSAPNAFNTAIGNGAWSIQATSSGVAQMATGGGTGSAVSSKVVTDGAWHRVLGTSHPTAGSVLYVDGVQVATRAPATNGFAATSVRLGSNGASGQGWTGRIGDVCAWDWPLTAAMARLDYEESRRGYPTALRRARPLWFGAPPLTPATGDLSATLGELTVASGGAAAVTGTLSASLDPLSLSAGGAAAVAGAFAATLGSFSLASAGTSAVAASLSATFGPVTLSAAGVSVAAGSVAATLGDVAVSATGVSVISGELAATLGAITLGAAGMVPAVGSASVPLGELTLASGGVVPAVGSLAATLESLTILAAASAPATGFLSITLNSLTAASTATARATATLAANLSPLTLTSAGTVQAGTLASPGGVVRRPGTLTRVLARPGSRSRRVRRPGPLTRVVRRPNARSAAMPDTTIEYESVEKGVAEVVKYCIDFTKFPEIAAGATVAGVDVPAVSGITTAKDSDPPAAADFEGPAVGKFWYVTVSGGTSGQEYLVKVNATFSTGSVRAVWVLVRVR